MIPQRPDPTAHFDAEGNLTVQITWEMLSDLGFPHFRRFVETTIPRDLFDWDDWNEPGALWIHWRYALEALYQFRKFYPDTAVTAESNPHFGQSPETILRHFGQEREASAP